MGIKNKVGIVLSKALEDLIRPWKEEIMSMSERISKCKESFSR